MKARHFLESDIKSFEFVSDMNSYTFQLTIFQVEMMDSILFLEKNIGVIQEVLTSDYENSFLIISSSFYNITSFVAFSHDVKQLLEKILGKKFNENILKLEGIMLRKDIVRKISEFYG